MAGLGPRCAAPAAIMFLISCVASVDELGDPETEIAASEVTLDPFDPPDPICDLILAKRWRGAVALGTDLGSASLPPRIATSANRTAMVVWLEYAGSNTYHIRANRYSFPGFFGTWQAQPDLVGTFTYSAAGGYPAISPEVAMDASGGAFVVWVEYAAAASYHVKARRFTPAGGWSGAVTLGSSALYTPPQVSVAADAAGNAIAVWEQQSSLLQINIRYSRFSNGAWSAEAPLENSAGSARRPVIDAAPGGTMIAAWTQIDVESSAYTRRFAGGAWGAITRVDSAFDTFPASHMTVDVGANGDAVVTWVAQVPGSQELWSNVASPAGAWATAQRVAGSTGLPAADAAIDAAGNGVVTWATGGTSNALGRRIAPGGALNPATQFLDNLAAGVARTGVASDDNGNAIAVWNQHDGTVSNVYGRHLRHRLASPGCPETWSWGGGPFLLEQAASATLGANIAMYGNGNAVAAWKQLDAAGETTYAALYY